jgi:uncharacterized protein (DUF736 family)
VNYDPNLKGVLFKNNKDGNEKRPDYRGSAVINNVDYNLSAWIKASQKTGDKYMSISFQPKTDSKPAKPAAKVEMTEDNWHDDSVPF